MYTLTDSTGGVPGGRANVAVSQAEGSAEDYVQHDGGSQFKATGAAVVDLTQTGKINSVATLNESAQVNDIVVDWLFNADKEVTVIYVTSVTSK